MAGKVTSIEGMVPQAKPLEVISYELSPLFTRGQAERYNPDELVATRGLGVYRSMMTDEQVKAVMVFKRDAITSRGWTFHYDDDVSLSDDEQILRTRVLSKIIERMRGSFEDALNSVARGRTFGYSMTEIVYDNITVNGKQFIGLNSLKARDASTFKFYTDAWGSLEKVVQRVDGDEINVKPEKFIHYVHCPEEDQFYGQSDLRQAYRSWFIKDAIIKLYATYLERFAGGFAALELQEGNQLAPNSPSHLALQGILQNMRNMAGMILPPNVKLNIIQPGNTAEYREALTYFDLAIAKALLVPNLLGLSHAGQTGSFAQSQTQLEAFFWTLNADTRRLEACLNEQLFKPLSDMNWGDGEYPIFQFKPASQDHVKWLVGTWKDLVGAKAVETTAEDEAYLRKLLEMPARDIDPDDEDDGALASDATAAFDAGQITAMLDVLAKVGDMTIPKEVGIQVLIQSFPMTEEQARSMVNPIVPKKPEPVPVLAPGQQSRQSPSGKTAGSVSGQVSARMSWDESKHPRGKTSADTTPGSFAPGSGSDHGKLVRLPKAAYEELWAMEVETLDDDSPQGKHILAEAMKAGNVISGDAYDYLVKVMPYHIEKARDKVDDFGDAYSKRAYRGLKELAKKLNAQGENIRFTWDESAHPRGETTDASTPGSFAPKATSGRSRVDPSKHAAEDLSAKDNKAERNAVGGAIRGAFIDEFRDASKDEKRARLVYVGAQYHEVNSILRGHNNPELRNTTLDTMLDVERMGENIGQMKLGDVVGALDKLGTGAGKVALDQAATLAGLDELTVYRGVWIHSDNDDEWFDTIKPGVTFTDPAFMSTSTDSGEAIHQTEFRRIDQVGSGLRHREQGRAAIFRMRVPRGAKGFIGNTAELEIVIARGSTYRVQAVTASNDDVPVVDLELVAQP
jgi:hypothetical protein